VGWLEITFAAGIAVLLMIMRRHRAEPVEALPATVEGRAAARFLLLLWLTVGINWLVVAPRFTPQRIVTEWMVTMTAIACTWLVFSKPVSGEPRAMAEQWPPGRIFRWTAAALVGGILLIPLAGTGLRFALFDGRPTGYSTQHVRFGPWNTNHLK
jgi:hypothetical protein